MCRGLILFIVCILACAQQKSCRFFGIVDEINSISFPEKMLFQKQLSTSYGFVIVSGTAPIILGDSLFLCTDHEHGMRLLSKSHYYDIVEKFIRVEGR